MRLVLALSILLLTACGPVPNEPAKKLAANYLATDADGCSVDSSSKLVNQHKVGPITNLVKDKIEWGNRSECNVKFDITVNGETHHLEESETGLENAESLCYYAKERARKNLLLELGGTFQSEAVVSCRKQES